MQTQRDVGWRYLRSFPVQFSPDFCALRQGVTRDLLGSTGHRHAICWASSMHMVIIDLWSV